MGERGGTVRWRSRAARGKKKRCLFLPQRLIMGIICPFLGLSNRLKWYATLWSY